MSEVLHAIAIFGGSFDPPHIGHEAVVNEALKSLDIDLCIVVPAFLNPFKSSTFLDEKTRFGLVRKLFKEHEKVIVSDYEIKQQRSVYTIETVEYFKHLYNADKIYLIIGADNLRKLHLWNSYEKLASMVEFVVASRSGYDTDIKHLDVDVEVSSTQLRENLNLKLIPENIQEEVKKPFIKNGM